MAVNVYLTLLNKICKGWIAEYKFHEKRKWRFDFALVEKKIATEINGGCWVQGRHNRGGGFIKDMEKLNAAQLLGWRVFQYTPQQISVMLKDIEEVLK